VAPVSSAALSSESAFPASTASPESATRAGNVAFTAERAAAVEHLLEDMTLEQLETLAIDLALRRFNNHRTRAARALGISVRTLQRKLNPGMPTPDRPRDEEPEGPAANIGVVGNSNHPMMVEHHLASGRI
jgi:DNA-binding NtrC family response regulator